MDGDEVIRVLSALRDAGIAAGITGGWGVDALLGRETRPHEDVDLGIDTTAVDNAIRVLAGLGYELVEDQRPFRLELHGTRGRVDLHPIEWHADGSGVQTGFGDATFAYPKGSLSAPGVIAGQPVHCGTPELQIVFHLGYEPKERDRRDMAALADAFGLILPVPY